MALRNYRTDIAGNGWVELPCKELVELEKKLRDKDALIVEKCAKIDELHEQVQKLLLGFKDGEEIQ